ncbi:hypothetical protein B0J12DRAFT_561719 [Macrophomina phaseolina]|uniref:Tetratricopeptide-like helical n=1 Tax=Macrophomina phaseolina TaxID=35725 RepID=A0ABQ8GV23_9PEZI|nr:hypothetical protein B0J12DRAFT_561719 [Macrophomina phaseolina]
MEDIAAIVEGNLSPYFKGVAKVQISALDFGHALSSERHRPLSEKTVARLVDILRREGCRRDDGANFVDAVVDDDALQAALAEVALSNADLKSWSITHPVIPLQRVQCLHGLHRIAAARSLLDKNDQWWTGADIFLDLPKDLGIKVIEGSVNEQPYADGIILRKILLYRREGNEALENKWWARLSTTKQKDLKQLLKKPLFMNALNELLDMPGLWYPIKLGTLHRLLTLRCDEELLRYLQHVRTVWSSILQCGEDQVSAEVVDRLTVERLDLLAPAASERDSKIIENLFRSGEIFGQVSNEAVRGRIKSNLSSVQVLIPTLRSFFENLKYLEPCSLILKRLLDPDDKRSIYRCLKAAYFSPSSQFIEYAEGRVHEYSNKTASEDMWTSYVQLWAFCFRNFPNMTSLEPRKELGKEKPSTTTNAALWHHLGNLAVKLGFRTEQAVIFQQESPYFTLAQQVIQSAHPGLTPDSSLVSQIARLLEHTSGDSPERNAVALTSNVTLPVERRCGRPFEDDHIRDREFMFLPIVYETETSHGPDISSFYVKQDLFKSFFGDLYVMVRIPCHNIFSALTKIRIGKTQKQ